MKRRSFLKVLTGVASSVGAGMSGIANAFDSMGFEHLSKNVPQASKGLTQYIARPTKAYSGDIYFDIVDKKYKVYTGDRWVDIQ